ncbi:MAG: TetR/AcrR family transcriptional regulator, transcriptional repressor of bet s [Actinomycetota bacterium]|nr:TetR/AcrR family transcriptional regulator, transcriptional repressor of bet s [Actinomycetota bacterium]
MQVYCYSFRVPRTVDHRERRREITYAVWQVVVKQGFGAVSLRNVAAEASISVGRIQHYFPTKDEMVRYSCQALVDQAGELYEARTADLGPAEALRFLLTHAVPATETLRTGVTLWYAYLARSADDPQIARIVRRAQTVAEEQAVRLLHEAIPDPDPVAASQDPLRLARRLLAMADGLALRVLVGQITASEATELLVSELGQTGIEAGDGTRPGGVASPRP